MEPNNPTPQKEPENQAPDGARPTYPDFHAEGIDIVAGSGVAEDNEFIKVDQSTPAIQNEPIPQREPVPEPVPAPPPAPEPIPEPVIVQRPPTPPTTNPYQGMVPNIQPQPQSRPLEEKKAAPVNDPSIKPLRTFKSDAEEAVKYQNVSTIDIAIAEQRKKEAQTKIHREKETSSSPGLYVIFAILIIVAIGGGWYYWFISSQDSVQDVSPLPTSIKTIIPTPKGSAIYLEPSSNPIILIGSKLAASNAGLGNVYALIPTLSSTSTVLASVNVIFKDTNIPSRLDRSLDTEYMIGTYTYDANSPFIILKNTFFQNAFSGMLEWEKDMRIDLLPIIQVTHSGETVVATTTPFIDAVVSNIDTRVLKNAAGEIILAYAFADKDTIVISTNVTALKYILEKLLVVRTIQ